MTGLQLQPILLPCRGEIILFFSILALVLTLKIVLRHGSRHD